MRYVIIGGGVAGTTAAEELRKLDSESEITLISQEQHPLYSRVLLPHYLVGKVERDRVFLKKEQWYGEQKIEWLRGDVVEKLDVQNKFVGLNSGREIEYDKLLIASGVDARVIEDRLRGVVHFRTLDDTDYLSQLLNEKTKQTKACIYGGGFIACDLLEIFAYHQLPTSIAFRGPYFWSRVFDQETGQLLNEHLEKQGVKVYPQAKWLDLVGDKDLQGLRTDQGQIDCELLAVGVGVVPDLSFIKEAGVKINQGILTNQFLETNAPNVYAAGDICEFYDVIVGRQLRIGTWMNSMSQGRVAAKNMIGDKTEFKLVSSYATNALGLEIIFVGDTNREQADQIVVRGSKAQGGVTQLFVKDNRLVGATIVGRNTDRPPITKLIQEKVEILDKLEKWKDVSESINL
ncbi:NAD(P)/FAD-dependent oxidoreductase [Patescibacteria group bacterium]